MSRSSGVAVAVFLGALFVSGCSGGQDSAPPPVQGDAAMTPTAPPEEAAAATPTDPTSAIEPVSPAPPVEARSANVAEAEAAPVAPATPAKQTSAASSGAAATMTPMPGTVIRQTDLKAEAAVGARTLGTLAADTPVTITARQSGWLHVTSGDARGWVRLLHVSSQPSAGGSSARRELEAAARVATGRAGAGNVAVTTGIRGLDEKELREAQPDDAELGRLESFGAQTADAQAYAKRRGLERRKIPYPPAPQAR